MPVDGLAIVGLTGTQTALPAILDRLIDASSNDFAVIAGRDHIVRSGPAPTNRRQWRAPRIRRLLEAGPNVQRAARDESRRRMCRSI